MSQQELIPIQHHPPPPTSPQHSPIPHTCPLPLRIAPGRTQESTELPALSLTLQNRSGSCLPWIPRFLETPHAHLSFPSLQQFVFTRHILLAEVWDTGRPARKVVRETVGVIKGRVGCLCAHGDAGQGFSGIHGDPHPAFLVSLTPARLSVLLFTSHCLPLSKLRIWLVDLQCLA